jgi:hypothetical protein
VKLEFVQVKSLHDYITTVQGHTFKISETGICASEKFAQKWITKLYKNDNNDKW